MMNFWEERKLKCYVGRTKFGVFKSQCLIYCLLATNANRSS